MSSFGFIPITPNSGMGHFHNGHYSKGHHRELIDAIKGGPAALSNFEYGARLTEIVLLGVVSLRLGGKKIYWDTVNMKAIGLPEADGIIREPVRKGWEMV